MATTGSGRSWARPSVNGSTDNNILKEAIPGAMLEDPLLCPDANPLEGFSFDECDRLTGDEEDRGVTWKGNSDISTVGEIAAIRVRLFQAKLFAYRL